jgi:cellulose synthase/poly-beta-1,6-N-acetylglucosamine synthase-like glycosyltransferase
MTVLAFVPFLLWVLGGTLLLLLWGATVHLLRMGLAAWSCPRLTPTADGGADAGALAGDALPVVTVQLPMRNERHVAERAIRAACALSWPRDRLQIQVLDDSDDDTVALVDAVCAELRGQGHDVSVLRRAERRGYKAGAMQAALATARGDYVAVLDADCVPPPDFLQRLLPPLIADPSLAFCQGRWSFDNEEHGLLTRLQALILHGLMVIEQDALSRAGLPMQFNGSGGVWRKAAVLAAGGWLKEGEHASVTEDLDLSYRAALRGARGRHLPEVAVRTELPTSMAAFRAQQARWVRGAAEGVRSLFRRLLRGELPPQERLALLAHLSRHARQPLLLMVPIWLPLALLYAPAHLPALGLSLAALHLAIGCYYGAALRRLGRSPLEAFLLAPALVALSVGLSLALSAALLAGMDGKPAEFVRTPKTGQARPQGPASVYRPPRAPLAYVEIALGIFVSVCAGGLLRVGDTAGALGCLIWLAGGLLWVGVASALEPGPRPGLR